MNLILDILHLSCKEDIKEKTSVSSWICWSGSGDINLDFISMLEVISALVMVDITLKDITD